MRQLGNIDFVELQVRRIAAEVDAVGIPIKSVSPPSAASPTARYHIAQDTKKSLILGEWLNSHSNDPALTVTSSFTQQWYSLEVLTMPQDFLPHLKQHLHARLCESDPLYNHERSEDLAIQDGILYQHSIMRVDFTTYDVQQDQDIIHIPFDKCDILVYNPQERGPYPWAFARVLGIYHAAVRTRAHPGPQTYYFLWVRWFKCDQSAPSFATARRFDRVSFVPHDSPDEEPFGFIDPATVIRGCHLIPDFNSGRTCDLMPASTFQDGDGDWKRFCVAQYVNLNILILSSLTCSRFSLSDRDLMMRFAGLGVGHLEYKARTVHRLIVEDEPNWSVLCPVPTSSESGPAGSESEDEDDTDSDSSPEDLGDDTF